MKTAIARKFSERLSWQFGFLMTVILIISMLGSSWLEYKNSNRITAETLNSRITSIGQMLTSITIDSLLVDDFVAIDDYMLNAVTQKGFVYAVLFGESGITLSHHINEKSTLVVDLSRQIKGNDLAVIIDRLSSHKDIVAKSFPISLESQANHLLK